MADRVVKVRSSVVAACMTCPLCHKLLDEATTISLCLHTCEFLPEESLHPPSFFLFDGLISLVVGFSFNGFLRIMLGYGVVAAIRYSCLVTVGALSM
ncbi:hypothetical protein MLD38_020622 [Melastoma candidum]|uniref:Uncharacterized protein n=1 Tax=Melastoma candidum TaxID=119954 RepID=A0ACB9QEG3_9MYRT|nr:hypothetical protein MLD38_020622 [Melastoma candidum]